MNGVLEFNYSKLKGRIVEKFGSQASFIDKLSMSEVTFIKKIKNGYFNQKEIAEIINALDLTVNDIPYYFFVK